MGYEQTKLSGRFDYDEGKTRKTHVSFNLVDNTMDWRGELNIERNRLLTPQSHIVWAPEGNHTILAGGDFRWNDFERIAVDAPDESAFGFFVQDEWTNSGKLSMTTALRYEKVEDIEAVFCPKISFKYTPTDWMRIRSSLGRGFHAPTLQERFEKGYGHSGRANVRQS